MKTARMAKCPRPWRPWNRVEGARFAEHKKRYPGNPLVQGALVAFENGFYSVMLRPLDEDRAWHVMVSTLEDAPSRDWRDLQRIKNELFGPNDIAIEIFPREQDVIDEANMTHLWVVPFDLADRIEEKYNLHTVVSEGAPR